MGDLIDTKKVDEIYRCVDVKEAIVYINLIGPPISLLLLLFAIIRMIYLKKRKGFLTKIILIIFISEMVQCISKMLQMVKYLFEDERDNKKIDDLDLDRGIICQIQIVLAISSDFCSLLSTLLLLSMGLIMLLSASAPTSLSESGNSYKYVIKQGIMALAGLFAMIILSKIDYRVY